MTAFDLNARLRDEGERPSGGRGAIIRTPRAADKAIAARLEAAGAWKSSRSRRRRAREGRRRRRSRQGRPPAPLFAAIALV
jgi:hypothetical protein